MGRRRAADLIMQFGRQLSRRGRMVAKRANGSIILALEQSSRSGLNRDRQKGCPCVPKCLSRSGGCQPASKMTPFL